MMVLSTLLPRPNEGRSSSGTIGRRSKTSQEKPMLTRCFVIIVGGLCLALLLTAPLSSQTFYGSVIGTVTDPSAARIPGAALTLVNTGTGERRAAISDEDGAYRFVNLVP